MQIDGWNPKDIGYDTGYNHTYGVGTDADAKSTGVAEGSKGECQTCKNRKYQDGSNENVSFKSASYRCMPGVRKSICGRRRDQYHH